jgi:hypothetical protein
LRYYFRYVARFPEETASTSLVFGAAIHAALELHFQELLVSGAPPSLDMLIEAWQTAWHKRQATVGLSETALEPELYRAARRMLLAFQASSLARPRAGLSALRKSCTLA